MGSFNNILTEVRERLGGRTTIDSRITRWINDAYFDLLMTPQYRFYELDKEVIFFTYADLRFYDVVIPSIENFWYIQMLRDNTNEREIRKKDIKTFDRMSHTTGHPSRYARYGNVIYLDPTPDGTYDILMRYRARPAELSSGSSTVLGREWDEPFILLSVVKGYEGLEQPTKAQSQYQLYLSAMARRDDVIMLEDEDKEPTVSPWLNEDLP